MPDTQENLGEHELAAQTFAWQKSPKSHSKAYLCGSLLGFILLIAQVHYFLGYSITQNPHIRPTLVTINKLFKRSLPPYKNIADFTVVGSHFSAIQNNQHQVQISFINHADFPQPAPFLLLTLRNLQGGILAQRIFDKTTYRQGAALNSLIAPNEFVNINLLINTPNHSIGGYSIELK